MTACPVCKQELTAKPHDTGIKWSGHDMKTVDCDNCKNTLGIFEPKESE